MALTSADYDLDGDLDWFATGMGVNNPFVPGLPGEQVLFENNGDGTFGDATYSAGLGGLDWGWGASFADFDNDGDEDLVSVGNFVTSLVTLPPQLATPGIVFENDGNGFLEEALDFGLAEEAASGLAIGDFDKNGFSDIVIVKTAFDEINLFGQAVQGDGKPVLLRNRGNNNRSITLCLTGTQSNPMGIGAQVTVYVPSMVPQVREVYAGSSFASTNSPWLTFGMGRRLHAFLIVDWPSGLTESFTASASTEILDLVEGSGFADDL